METVEDIVSARRAARGRLVVPAVALFVLSLIGAANSVFMMVSPPPPIAAKGLDPETRASVERGRDVAAMAGTPFVLFVYVIALLGPVSMLTLQQRPVAVIGTVAAILPCSCVFVPSLPFAIWALIALYSPVVKRGFALSSLPAVPTSNTPS